MAKRKKSFQALQLEWYGKLADAGFQDIENLKGLLKSWTQTAVLGRPNVEADYYYLATHFLEQHRFSCKVDRLIWKLHSDGMSINRICIRTGLKHTDIQRRIERIRKIFLDTLKQS